MEDSTSKRNPQQLEPIADIMPLVELLPLPQLAEEEGKVEERWQAKQLNARHREILRRIIEGATYKEIAEQMGLSVQAIMLIATSKLARTQLAQMESQLDHDTIRRAEGLAAEALDTLKVLMRRARSEMVRKAAATEVLGIAGYSKIEKKQVSVVSGEEVIKYLQQRRREAAIAAIGDGRDNGEAIELNSLNGEGSGEGGSSITDSEEHGDLGA